MPNPQTATSERVRWWIAVLLLVAVVGVIGCGETSTEKVESKLTSGQKAALEAAKSYLPLKGFSKRGLIQQLTSGEGDGPYSKSDAAYGATHAGADWNAEAVEAAKDHLGLKRFSKSELIRQLSSSAGDGFTKAQAEYAVSKVY
jgi:hypothetical protein